MITLQVSGETARSCLDQMEQFIAHHAPAEVETRSKELAAAPLPNATALEQEWGDRETVSPTQKTPAEFQAMLTAWAGGAKARTDRAREVIAEHIPAGEPVKVGNIPLDQFNTIILHLGLEDGT